MQGTSRPLPGTPDLCLLPSISQVISPPCRIKNHATLEISLGICPTMLSSFFTATANLLCSFLSVMVCKISPLIGVQMRLYTWCPRTVLSKQKCSLSEPMTGPKLNAKCALIGHTKASVKRQKGILLASGPNRCEAEVLI